tara:strand:+ start:505 stop:1068 length:564 start_codon:yes stop_codon:yes gene_type:complete
MFLILLNIIIKSLKFDQKLYTDKKYFSATAIYFSSTIILITSLISIIPNNYFLKYMGDMVGSIDSPRLISVVFSGFLTWLIKSGYLYIFGTLVFPSKLTQKKFKKTLIVVGYAHAPFILNFLVLDINLLFIIVVSYLWYSATLVVGINYLYQYNNYFKSILLVMGPIIILIIFTLIQLSSIPIGTLS